MGKGLGRILLGVPQSSREKLPHEEKRHSFVGAFYHSTQGEEREAATRWSRRGENLVAKEGRGGEAFVSSSGKTTLPRQLGGEGASFTRRERKGGHAHLEGTRRP